MHHITDGNPEDFPVFFDLEDLIELMLKGIQVHKLHEQSNIDMGYQVG